MSDDLAPTERVNPRSVGLDLLSTPALIDLLVSDQAEAVRAALSQKEPIATAVDEIAARLVRGGALHYVGAGSSGRIATLDAAEMPPTYATPPELVHAHVAGGPEALLRSIESAEDNAADGEAAMRECVKPGDAVAGISASGGTRFVIAAIERARTLGAYTVSITSAANSPLARVAQTTIVLHTGPEILAGSTRMKAGTAQKIVLNAISTAVMVRLGKVHENLMVDLVASNEKLRARALRLVCRLAGVNEARARELLDSAGGRVKVAVVMARCAIDAAKAREILDRNGGSLRALL